MSEFRIRECREIATQALRLASRASAPDVRNSYVQLATLCQRLADELSRRTPPRRDPGHDEPIKSALNRNA